MIPENWELCLGDVMYSTVTTVNNTVLYILKIANRVNLKSSHHKINIVTMCSDGC